MESEGVWGTEAKACKRLGAMGWMSQALGSVVGWELQVLGAWWAGCFERLGAQRPAPAFAPARASCVCLWFCEKMAHVCVLIPRVKVAQNPASHLPAGLQTSYAPILNPRDLKRKRAGFFWAAWGCRSARAACEPAAGRLRAVIGAIFDVTNPSDNRI